MINEIHQMLTDLKDHVKLIDYNINILQGKANGSLFPNARMPLDSKINIEQQSKPSLIDDLQKDQKIIGVPLVNKSTRVFGKICGPDKKPINNVSIIVRNDKQEQVKQTKTNIEGDWSAFLPSGKYFLTYNKELMAPTYRIIEIKEGQTELELF